MSECVYCSHEIEGEPDNCPACGQRVDLEPAAKSAFGLRYASCCRTRLSLVGIVVGMLAFCSYLVLYWLPADAGILQIAGVLLPGMFIGAIIGVYAVALFAFLLAAIGDGNNISSTET